MKKFALLGAVAALATAGGVFAAWTYNEATYNTSSNPTVTIGVEDAVLTGNVGSATITGVLQGNFVHSGEGMGIAFTPEAEKDTVTIAYTSNNAEVAEYVAIDYTFSIAWKDGYALPSGVTVEAVNPTDVTKAAVSEASKSYTLTLNNTWFTISGELDTHTKYEAFRAAIENATFTLTVAVTASLS